MGSRTVTCDGNPIMLQGSTFSKSTGDEAGTAGGVVSVVTKGAAEFISYSFDVTADGKPVARLGDLMLGNKGGTFNTPPAPEVQAPLPAALADTITLEKPEPDSLGVKLVDGAGKAIKNRKFVLLRPEGTKEEGTTDGAGEIQVKDTVSGLGQVLFPELEDVTLRSKE